MAWPAGATAALFTLASFGIGWAVTRLGVAIASRRLRRSDEEPWIERARRAYPARRLVTLNMLLVALALGECVFLGGVPGLAMGRGSAPAAVLSGLAGLFGVMAVGYGLERRICRPRGGMPAPGIALSWLLVLPVLVPLGLMLALLPARLGWPAAAVLALGAALATFHLYGGWVALLLRFGLARPASPRLAAIVDRVAARTAIRPRTTLELASLHANALALPVPKLLVFTGPLLEALDDDELEAVAAHELGHLAEPRAVYLMRVATAYLPTVAVASIPLGGSYGLWAGLAPLAALLAGVFVMRRVGRRMEERSDRLGREHEGDFVGSYARALEKIYEANLMPVVMRGRRHVHPHLYDRMIASGTTPSYDRPAPPARELLAVLPTVLLVAGVIGAVATGQAAREHPGRRLAHALASQAQESYKAGDLEAAARLFRRAAALDPLTPHYPAGLAVILLRFGRLDEAEAAARDARARLASWPAEAKDVEASLAHVRETIRWLREVSRRHGSAPGHGGSPLRPEATSPSRTREGSAPASPRPSTRTDQDSGRG